MSATIDRLMINSPYEEPQYHWRRYGIEIPGDLLAAHKLHRET